MMMHIICMQTCVRVCVCVYTSSTHKQIEYTCRRSSDSVTHIHNAMTSTHPCLPPPPVYTRRRRHSGWQTVRLLRRCRRWWYSFRCHRPQASATTALQTDLSTLWNSVSRCFVHFWSDPISIKNSFKNLGCKRVSVISKARMKITQMNTSLHHVPEFGCKTTPV